MEPQPPPPARYNLILWNVEDRNVGQVITEIARTFEVDQKKAATIVQTSPIILVDGLELAAANLAKKMLESLTRTGADLRIAQDTGEKIPKLTWPVRPKLIQLIERAARKRVLTNAFRCPSCGEVLGVQWIPTKKRVSPPSAGPRLIPADLSPKAIGEAPSLGPRRREPAAALPPPPARVDAPKLPVEDLEQPMDLRAFEETLAELSLAESGAVQPGVEVTEKEFEQASKSLAAEFEPGIDTEDPLGISKPPRPEDLGPPAKEAAPSKPTTGSAAPAPSKKEETLSVAPEVDSQGETLHQTVGFEDAPAEGKEETQIRRSEETAVQKKDETGIRPPTGKGAAPLVLEPEGPARPRGPQPKKK